MATIVMVAAAWHGGWALTPIARKLRAQGHEVLTPTLTGLGERSHLARAGINLETHIEDVANVVLFERLDEIVLCGHSYAGMVITGVADRLPERVASLVYVDAFVPQDGGSSNHSRLATTSPAMPRRTSSPFCSTSRASPPRRMNPITERL